MAAEVRKTIDPDNGGGTDYTSLDAWEDALGGTTTGHLPNDDQIAIAECRSSGGTNDTAPVTVNGWTTDSTRYILITGDSALGDGDGDFPADGIWDATKYVLENDDDASYAIQIRENYVNIRKLQILDTITASAAQHALQINVVVGANYFEIDSCIIKGVCTGDGVAYGINVTDVDVVVLIYNTIVSGFRSVSHANDTGFRGISVRGTTVDVFNCTIYGNYHGLYEDGAGTYTSKNNAIGNNADDTFGTWTSDYNCDDDNDGGNNQSPSGANWANEFVTPGSDFTLKAGGNCINNGTADLFTEDDDIINTGRPQGAAWDIGAFELIVVAGAAGIMTTNTGYWGPTF